MEKIIDAKGLIVGRMGTYVAKQLLMGETINIVNCEEAILTGSKPDILGKWKQRQAMGQPTKGPFILRMPDRFIKRSIRGMIPYKQPKGKEAFKRLMCYIGVPDEFKDKKMENLENAKLSNSRSFKFMKVKDVCKELGAKI